MLKDKKHLLTTYLGNCQNNRAPVLITFVSFVVKN